jgi:hypothetical protein
MRDLVSSMQDSDVDAVEAAASIYSPGKRESTDTPVKYIRPLMRGNMGSSSVPNNGADTIKKWHEESYDSGRDFVCMMCDVFIRSKCYLYLNNWDLKKSNFLFDTNPDSRVQNNYIFISIKI